MDESKLLAEAVARVWQGFSPSETGRADTLDGELMRLLRGLEATPAADAEPLRAEVVSLLTTAGLAKHVEYQLADMHYWLARAATARPVDVSGMLGHHRHSLVEVAYATDRQSIGGADPATWFGGDRGNLSFGVVGVTIPDDHRMGALEKPRAWPLRFRKDVRKNPTMAGRTEDPGEFATMVERALGGTPDRDLLVFVHGYNVGFIEAVRRLAQIAYDLDFKGVPVLYSWPSAAAMTHYFADGETAEWSQENFGAFLRLALTRLGADRIHLLAHSMGNRLLTAGLAGLAADPPAPGSARLGQVVFAAPDVDSGVFAQRAKRFIGTAERFTLYASDNDRALNASQRFAKYHRAGQAGADIVSIDGMDTVDATELDTGFLGHSYVGSHRSVISDLYSLIQHGNPPDRRFGLRRVVTPRGSHWAFRR